MTVRILIGDVRARLAELPSDHVDVVVTSPPYWGLRDYDVDGQLGLEPTLGAHLAVMVDVFREVRRVLKPTGTVWLNYGDCYATSPNGRPAAEIGDSDDRTFRDKPFSTVGPIYERQPDSRQAARRGRSGNLGNGGFNGAAVPEGRIVAGGYLKPKDLCMVPNRLAIALQEDGWWVRSEIIWAKPNPMPESINDRPATSHEKVFLLTKSERYFYDAAAVRQAGQPGTAARYGRGRSTDHKWADGGPGRQSIAQGFEHMAARIPKDDRRDSFARVTKNTAGAHGQKPQFRPDREATSYPRGLGRNLRNYEPAPIAVWPLSTRGFSEAHFATFPPELAERCLLAGASAHGCCPVCGSPWARVVSKAFVQQEDCSDDVALRTKEQLDPSSRWAGTRRRSVVVGSLGFYPSCGCAGLDPLPPYPQTPGRAGLSPPEAAAVALEWRAACEVVDQERAAMCDAAEAVPVVRSRALDPFGGAGTVGMVADRAGLDCDLIELNPKYAEIARRRIVGDAGLLADVEAA